MRGRDQHRNRRSSSWTARDILSWVWTAAKAIVLVVVTVWVLLTPVAELAAGDSGEAAWSLIAMLIIFGVVWIGLR